MPVLLLAVGHGTEARLLGNSVAVIFCWRLFLFSFVIGSWVNPYSPRAGERMLALGKGRRIKVIGVGGLRLGRWQMGSILHDIT